MDRNAIETRVFGALRWVVIAFLTVVTVFPFYYMVLLSVRSIDRVVQEPGRLWVGAGEFTVSTYRAVLRSVGDGGQGFLVLLRNSLLVALATVLLTLLLAIPGSYAARPIARLGRYGLLRSAASLGRRGSGLPVRWVGGPWRR